MKFYEFAQLMHPVIGGASSTHAFVKTLFDAIIIEDGREVLEEVGEDTYKSYYNGNTGISRIAKKLGPYLEPEEFVAFCNEFQDSARDTLCDKFRVFLPEITAHNASELLANLFRDIITEAASTKRKNTSKSAKRKAEEQRQRIADATGATVVEGFTSLAAELVGEEKKAEQPEAEVVDDDTPSGAAEGDKKITIIQNQTNVVQNGENNFNLTNNGTLNFNF